MSEDELRDLLVRRKTAVLEGFKSSAGKRFAASLVLKDDFSTGFEFAGAKVLDAPCPKCGGALHYAPGHGDVSPRYACVNRDFTLWMTLAGRTFTDREAAELVRKGALAPVHGFVSRAKKKFAAGVRMSPEYRAELVFDDK